MHVAGERVEGGRVRRGQARRRLSGIQLFVASFAGIIAVGALGFLVLPGLYVGPRLGMIDALFTAASAVCVTGLIVVDTATHFTRWGQLWIQVLIQAGGIGILTFTTLIIRLLGRRGGLDLESGAGAGVAARLGDPRALLRAVVTLTFAIESAGALGLWLLWRGALGGSEALWHAVFHAISAFCNAGFSTFTDSLTGFRASASVVLLVAGLVILGGLGFVVLEDVRARFVGRSVRRLSTHTRLALVATVVLIVGATAVFYLFEADNVLRPLGAGDRAVNAVFMAITPRTAGFNTVDYDQVTNPSMALTVGLMLIGGSPGGTAGGIKTTTALLLVLVLVSRVRGAREVSAWGRSVPPDVVQTAAGLVVGAIAILAVAILALLLTEAGEVARHRESFAQLVFEAHSAFGTVGLSMGKTAELTPVGRLVITGLMFVGRVGPLSLAAAMAFAAERRPPFRYAYDEVVVG
jgi:trk system potassium uptake protein TrkH